MTLVAGERFVVDASVAVKWVVPEPESARAAVLRSHQLIVPDLFFSECANILWKKLRRGDLSERQAIAAALILEKAELVVVPTQPHLARAVAIAMQLDHPASDAMYLATAEAFAIRLVTADERLVRRAEQRGGFRDMLVLLSEIDTAGYSA